jgi:DNA-binding NtrC family response regulator
MNKPISILVVSSEIRNRNSLRDVLNRQGCKTIHASTVGECEEVFANQSVDLVFCDRGLADGTYREILAMTRLRSPCVRLVVTSRLADREEYLEALDNGAFDLITSPSQTADVVRVISRARHDDEMTSTAAFGGPSGLRGRPGLMSAT